jgi:hypothetical protein
VNRRILYNKELGTAYPEIAQALCKTKPDLGGLSREFLNGTHNLWARDYMPVQVRNHFVKFRYLSRGEGKVPADTWNWLPSVKRSDLYLDGGNCQMQNGTAIVTDIIFKDNPSYRPSALCRELESLLQCQVVVIPQEPGDILGHSDGMVAWIPGRKAVFLNDYKDRFGKSVEKVLSGYGIQTVPFPLLFDQAPSRHRMVCAFGYYINFLKVGIQVFMPTFGLEEDLEAKEILEKNVKCEVVEVPCARLSLRGGCIHCVTVDYQQEAMARRGQ